MRISSKDTLAGHPILVIRRLLRAGGGSPWTRGLIEDSCNVTPGEAGRIAQDLEAQGYLRPDDSERGGPIRWRVTTKGRALAMASARRPIHRKTADRVLAEFLQRVARVRDDERFLYKVERAAVFGSYLSDVARLGDVDVFYRLMAKDSDAERLREREERHIRAAMAKGRRFRNIVGQLVWPQNEVALFLRARSPVLHLHDMREDGLHRHVTHLLIYTDQKGVVRRGRSPR